MDGFISAPRAAFFVGDGREFDPNAPWKASRFQLYINPSLCVVDKWVNTSRVTGTGPLFDGRPYGPHQLNKVTAASHNGACVVEWRLWNGFCERNLVEPICPPIDGRLVITPNGSGGWVGNILEDKFPSRGLYWWRNGTWETISQRPEGIWTDLYSKRRHVEQFRIERDQSLPPGCTLQCLSHHKVVFAPSPQLFSCY